MVLAPFMWGWVLGASAFLGFDVVLAPFIWGVGWYVRLLRFSVFLIPFMWGWVWIEAGKQSINIKKPGTLVSFLSMDGRANLCVRVVIAACHERRCFEFAAAVQTPVMYKRRVQLDVFFAFCEKMVGFLIHQYPHTKQETEGGPMWSKFASRFCEGASDMKAKRKTLKFATCLFHVATSWDDQAVGLGILTCTEPIGKGPILDACLPQRGMVPSRKLIWYAKRTASPSSSYMTLDATRTVVKP